MEITVRRSHPKSPEIRQSRLKRDWMDGTYNKHAYQCLPMSVANVSGWEIVLPNRVVVIWDEPSQTPRVIEGQESADGWRVVHNSITGIVSFSLGYSFHTPPGLHLWLGGAPNLFIDGAVPLTACIPSDWWPDEVNMNWAITKHREPVVFEAGCPFAFFTFYRPGDLSDVEFVTCNSWDDPEHAQRRAEYNKGKFEKLQNQPWTWTRGIRTGLDSRGESIGPAFSGLPELNIPAKLD